MVDPAAAVCLKCGVALASRANPAGLGSGALKSKMVAGLLGIFAGGLGIHRFCLGYTVIGVIQVLVTVVLGIATCGLGILAGWIWGFVEGILILTDQINKDAQGRPLADYWNKMRRGFYRQIDLSQLRLSLYCSWLIISIPLVVAVVLPLVGSQSLIQSITPLCVWKTRFGRECPGCGLTTAFVRIGRGQWRDAMSANAAGVPLYAAFALNSLLWLRCLLRSLRCKYVDRELDMGNSGTRRNAGGIPAVPG
jgi:TM2 domain-containing membrane protein YozV